MGTLCKQLLLQLYSDSFETTDVLTCMLFGYNPHFNFHPFFRHLHYESACGFDICYSCTPDREILRFTPCEKFLSHPRYLTPVAPCVQMFFFNTGCVGRHVISSLSAHVTMTSKRFKSKWRTPRFYHFSR